MRKNKIMKAKELIEKLKQYPELNVCYYHYDKNSIFHGSACADVNQVMIRNEQLVLTSPDYPADFFKGRAAEDCRSGDIFI